MFVIFMNNVGFIRLIKEARLLFIGNIDYHYKYLKILQHYLLYDVEKPTTLTIESLVFLCCAPSMGDNLVVKVHYRLGSRNC